ncbi:MAG: DUF1565 domain-containing protein [Polyangiaceae bacterium]
MADWPKMRGRLFFLAMTLPGCALIFDIEDRRLAEDGGAGGTATGAGGNGGGGAASCDPTSCGPGFGCDPDPSMGCVPCGAPDPSLGEVWVDASSPKNGTGTSICPFPTITAGLAFVATSSATTRTVHVAAGLFDGTTESFPLALVGPVTLLGAGVGETIVRGGSSTSLPSAGVKDLTILVSSASGPVDLASLTLEPIAPGLGTTGVACVNGNAPLAEAPPVAEPPPGDFRLRDVEVHDFNLGVLVTSTPEGGCFAEITGSRFVDNFWAVWSIGCDGSTRPALRVGGPATEDANFFTSHNQSDTAGVNVWDCTKYVAVDGNTFDAAWAGVAIAAHWRPTDTTPRPYMRVAGNTFHDSVKAGLWLGSGAHANELVGNSFEASQIGILLTSAFGETGASVDRARENIVRNNVFGLVLQDGDAQSYAQSDFGTSGDPGMNVLSCNQIDVAISTTSTTPIEMSGNAWDHVPPAEVIGTSVPQGTDVARATAAVAAVSVSDASVAEGACE